MDLNHLIEKVKGAAIDAGIAILNVYQNESNFRITEKKDKSPLTIADKKANDVICKILKEVSPEIPIISEENKQIPYSERKNFKYAWLVDPLDGTKEFIKKNGEFTVNIALIYKEHIVLGVVYVPVTDELYWAIKGQGAFFLHKKTKSQRLRAPQFKMDDVGLNVVCSRSHLNEKTATFIGKLNEPNKVSKGSSLKFLILAQGKAHLYPRLAPTMEWDTGAAQIILEESGGSVINEETGLPVIYNKKKLLNPFFIAYGNLK
ncbi:MAG: 3'(2'),5'-bisphosphate nucleotidase CysQ [Saprospiraceae bacterium]